MSQRGGEADSYYNDGARTQANAQYGAQSQMQYPPQAASNAYQGPPESKYQQPPPGYGQNFNNAAAPPMVSADAKHTYEQTFKLEKPRYNDLWAGILVRPFVTFPSTNQMDLTFPAYPDLSWIYCRLWYLAAGLLCEQSFQRRGNL